MPLPEGRGTGLGKRLKIINRCAHASRSTSPHSEPRTWSSPPRSLTVWLPLFFRPEKACDVFGPALMAGAAKRSDDLGRLDIATGGLQVEEAGTFEECMDVTETERNAASS